MYVCMYMTGNGKGSERGHANTTRSPTRLDDIGGHGEQTRVSYVAYYYL